MNAIVIDSVSKIFRQRPSLWPWAFRRRTNETRALSDLYLSVPHGSVQVLLGPNGSGKTTVLKLISTMLLPDAGSVLVTGCDTQRRAALVRRTVGFAIAAERSYFPRLTARENLDFFAALDEVPRPDRKNRIAEFLVTVGLADESDKLVMNFSSGMYQRLGIARALLKNPSVLLLDEPSRSLDPASARRLCQLIRKLAHQGTTVVVASHNFQETSAVADSVAILCRGVLRGEWSAAEIREPENLRALYFHSLGEFDSDCVPPFELEEDAYALAR